MARGRPKKTELYPTGEATEEKMVDEAGAYEDLHPSLWGFCRSFQCRERSGLLTGGRFG
jgi:hypothetical protein